MSVRVKMRSSGISRVLVLLLTIQISGCGFQLRGSLGLPEDISPLYVEQNNARELARELKRLLAQNKIIIADDESGVNSRISLLSENKSRRVLSVDGDGRAKEYLLTYTVEVLISVKQGKGAYESISLSRSLLFDSEAVLAFNNESVRLYREMLKKAASLILLKLQAHSQKAVGQQAENSEDEASTGNAESGTEEAMSNTE